MVDTAADHQGLHRSKGNLMSTISARISARLAAAVLASGIAVAIGIGVPNLGSASAPTAAAAAKVDAGDLLVIGGPAITLPTAVVAG